MSNPSNSFGAVLLRPEEQADPLARLRASKARHLAGLSEAGHEAGYGWARNEAEFADLEFMHSLNLTSLETLESADHILKSISCSARAENSHVNEFDIYLAICPEPHIKRSREWILEFIRGAQQFRAEIDRQL